MKVAEVFTVTTVLFDLCFVAVKRTSKHEVKTTEYLPVVYSRVHNEPKEFTLDAYTRSSIMHTIIICSSTTLYVVINFIINTSCLCLETRLFRGTLRYCTCMYVEWLNLSAILSVQTVAYCDAVVKIMCKLIAILITLCIQAASQFYVTTLQEANTCRHSEHSGSRQEAEYAYMQEHMSRQGSEGESNCVKLLLSNSFTL